MSHRQVAPTLWAVLVGLLFSAGPYAAGQTPWALENPTDANYVDEPVRVGVAPPARAGEANLVVLADGKEVPWQREEIDGNAAIWVSATIAPGQKIEYAFRAGRAARAAPKVKLSRDGDTYVLDNGLLAVKVPADAARSADALAGAPQRLGPISAVRLPDGRWVGQSFWSASRKLKSFRAEVVGDGTVFAKVRLRYEFEGLAGLWGKTPSFATIDVSLAPGRRHVDIEESHEMSGGEFWEFQAAAGWAARKATCEIFGGAAGKPMNRENWPADLKPIGWSAEALEKRYAESDPRIGDTLLWLIPRWNQHYQDGWLFAVHDGKFAVGAIPCRAGRWYWPHDNKIEVKAKDAGDYAGLRCPTWRGRRQWMLVAGPADQFVTTRVEEPARRPGDRLVVKYKTAAEPYAARYAFRGLDKIAHEYITTWPGRGDAAGGKPAYPESINPLRVGRGWMGGSHGGVSAATPLQRLLVAQVLLDADLYGTYWTFWSPENPNFYTGYMSRPMGMVAEFKDHPRFAELVELVKRRFWEDVYHSATLPGGAGQECPGYYGGARGLHGMAAKFKDTLGFDATGWPQFRAGQEFIRRISQPRRDAVRLFHPGGDTHPGPDGPRKVDLPAGTDVRAWRTEELPGFGVIFRNRCGTDRETYLAFKAGPNRGHFHGDQLAFHWCANAQLLGVDHFCSYRPRAGQEHMHNRVAFATDDLPYANMDGYERLIAFKTGDGADAAIGQVESPRLRYVTKFPPEDWDRDQPQKRLDGSLVYRRTMVQVKAASADAQDYFVIRDQWAGPALKASWCLHVYGDKCSRDGRRIEMDGLTVFVAAPADFRLDRHDWSHANGGGEKTIGVRLAVPAAPTGEFITVLYPSPSPPKMEAIARGVRVGADEVVFGGGIDGLAETTHAAVRRDGKAVLTLTGKDIDLDRSQGRIGLFVPDAGYPFGPIPDWLIRQRIGYVPPPATP